jgi:DNA-binding transcriptional LysR family regulator
MTLTQLRYLIAIVDAGLNITQAAEKVHATQPGISKQLKALEDELGFLLFQRKGRSLEALTEAGEVVLAHARRALAEAANIRAYAANRRGDRAGQLHLATTHTQARFVLPAAIGALSREYPQVGVQLQSLADNDVLPHLAKGNADVAIVSSVGAAPAGGHAIPLYRWRRVVVVRKGHPLASLGRAPTLEELSQHPLVSYHSSSQPESSLRRAFSDAGLGPTVAMTAHDADLIKTYVRAGLGVGILAEMAVSAVADADLVVLPAPAVLPECTTWAVVPKERVLRRYALELFHHLAPQLDRHDLQRVLAGHQEAAWPTPPAWADLGQAITI